MILRPPQLSCSRSLLAPLSPAPCRPYNLTHSHNHSSLLRPHTPASSRALSTTAPVRETHYEVLRVPPTATKAELKKQFYALSKETHPDTNPGDAQAAARFTKVSEAYSVLANDEKREVYDREQRTHARTHTRSTRGTYAGSRPPTGLSKRRGTFRGPPPSFYAQGSTPSREEAERKASEEARQKAYNASNYEWDPGFNSKPIFNTQTAEDVRRKHRRSAEMAAAQAYAEEEGAFWGRFVAVSAVVGVGVGIGTVLVNMGAGNGRGGLVQGDGTRRKKAAT